MILSGTLPPVTAFPQNGRNLGTLMAIIRYNSGRLDPKTMQFLLDVRGFLERPALFL